MSFSELLLDYIRKHYSPISTRIIHILIIGSILISSAILLIQLGPSIPIITIAIAYTLVFVVTLIFTITRLKNTLVEKMERAIILNINTIDAFDAEHQRVVLERIDDTFYTKSKSRSKKSRKEREKDCFEILDPENKSKWDATRS